MKESPWIGPITFLVAGAFLGASLAGAQAPLPARADSALQRARRLANSGSVTEARAVVDSILAASMEGSPEFVEAMFQRASLTESADQARRDYLKIALDYSLFPRAEDALLRLAQLALARGERATAKKYLDRLSLEHASGTSRASAAYWMGRVYFDEGALAAGCASLAEAKVAVSPADVELSNQIAFYAQQCAGVQRAAEAARADSTARMAAKADSAVRADSLAKAREATRPAPRTSSPAPSPPTARPAGAAARLEWSVQVAAFPTKPEAVRLAEQLSKRGYAVRVTQESPFRVRIGRYPKRGDAAALVAKLKNAKMEAIVVAAEKP